MIGFGEHATAERAQTNEDPETRELCKRKLYSMLSLQYFLPSITTKGITRDYLVKVYKNEVLTVPLFEIKHFEVELSPAMTKRAGIPNNSLLVRKMNGLLSSRQMPPLGFEDFEPPEEVSSCKKNWLYRVVRFIDPQNMLQFFESPVHVGDPADAGNNPVHRAHYGRLKASKFFHRLPDVKRDRKLWDHLHDISSSYRSYLCQRLIVEKLNAEIEAAMKKRTDLERTLDNLISQAAYVYTTIEKPSLRGENIMYSENVSKEMRDHILLNSRL